MIPKKFARRTAQSQGDFNRHRATVGLTLMLSVPKIFSELFSISMNLIDAKIDTKRKIV